MHAARWRLVWLALTALLFFAWIGWLAFQVRHRPVVVARTPFLVADVDVIAAVNDLDGPVTVKEVLWAREPQFAEGLRNQPVDVTNLRECRADWQGSGDYLLPLLKTGDARYEVADPTGLTEEKKRESRSAVPPSRSPGYEPPVGREARAQRPPHIYPATPETLAQLRQALPAK